MWSDLFFCEVVDENDRRAGARRRDRHAGDDGADNNNITPFLRWNSGDLISMRSKGDGSGPWSIFPVMRHARRTVGFFKVRGVNINHNELEDLMFFNQAIQDFKAEVVATDEGLDLLRLLVEPRRGLDTRRRSRAASSRACRRHSR